MAGWRIGLWALLVLGALFFLYLVRGILLPFIVSFIIAALLEPSVRKLRVRGMTRNLAVALVVGSFVVVVFGVGIIAAPSVARQVVTLNTKVDDLVADVGKTAEDENFFLRWDPLYQVQREKSTGQIDKLLDRYSPTLERFGIPTTQRALVERYVEPQRPQIAKIAQSAVHAFFGFLSGIFSQILLVVLVPILVPMMLAEMEEMRRRGPRWIPYSLRAGAVTLLGDIGQVFIRYLRGISLVVLLFTLAQTTLLILMGVPYGFLLGVLFGGLYLIPYIGNLISCVVLFLVIGLSNASGNFLFATGSPWAYALLVTVMFLLIGSLFDHLIYPQMVGHSVGLSPVVSMFVILCGGALFGLPGMLIAFPLAGSMKIILDRLLKLTSAAPEALALPAVPLRHRLSSSP